MKRVIIIGAGANKDLGYPDGSELLEIIKNMPLSKTKSTEDEPYELLKTALENIKTISMNSIDSYISALSNEDERNVMKSLIIAIIRYYENDSKIACSWYKYLSPLIFRPIDIGSLDEEKLSIIKKSIENLSIVTFNYDVSLERFIYTYLSKVYNVNKKSLEKIFNTICDKIFHVYGSVAGEDIFKYISKENEYAFTSDKFHKPSSTPEEDENAFTSRASYKLSPTAYNYISLSLFENYANRRYQNISSIRGNLECTPEIRDKIPKKSDILYILGFGFDQDNMDLIDLRNFHWSTACFVTNYEDNKRLKRLIYNALSKKMGQNPMTQANIYQIPIVSSLEISKALSKDFNLVELPVSEEKICTYLSPYQELKNK